jgi:hypothetical protein
LGEWYEELGWRLEQALGDVPTGFQKTPTLYRVESTFGFFFPICLSNENPNADAFFASAFVCMAVRVSGTVLEGFKVPINL